MKELKNKYKLERLELLKPYKNNSKVHTQEQVGKIAKSIEEFGFLNPVIVNENLEIIAGHGRVLAAKKLGMESIPTLLVTHLTEEQRRAYIIADNKLAEANWDESILTLELESLIDLNFDIELTGFELSDIITTEDIERTEISLMEVKPYDRYHILLSIEYKDLLDVNESINQLIEEWGDKISVEKSSN